MIEKALYNRLIDHLNNNSLLNPQQFGFRKNLPTDNAIFSLTHEILKALNSRMVVGSIFFDLEEAFDSINHSLLIKNLLLYGVLGKSKLLIESYLTNRYQSSTKQPFVRCKIRFKIEEGKTWHPTGIDFGPSLVYIIH